MYLKKTKPFFTEDSGNSKIQNQDIKFIICYIKYYILNFSFINLFSSFLKSIIFGGIDGTLTSIGITAAGSGANIAWTVLVIFGCSCVIANALHLGLGEYLSSKAHREFVTSEKRREQWEFKNFKEGEIKELINIFEERGMKRADSELVVRKMAEYDSFFVNMMITEELGLQIPDDDEALLLKDSFIMFMSFAIFGSLPLIIYCFGLWNLVKIEDMFHISIFVSFITLFTLGSLKFTFR